MYQPDRLLYEVNIGKCILYKSYLKKSGACLYFLYLCAVFFVINAIKTIMGILQEGAQIGVYKVQHLIKENEYTETYKVVSEDNNPYFLKLYVLKRTPAKLLKDESREVAEIVYLRSVNHTNLVSYIAHGVIDSPVGECQYVVTNYFTGEVLADKLSREGTMEEAAATEILTGILNGLKCLHDAGICHNDITPANIMLSESMGGAPELIDMGHASPACSGSIPFVTSDLDVRFCANAATAGVFNEYTDLFSAFMVYYTMLAGKTAWDLDVNNTGNFAQVMNQVKRHRKNNPLDLTNLSVSERAKYMLEKGLALTQQDGYRSAEEALSDLQEPDLSKKKRNSEEKRSSSSSNRSSSRKHDSEPLFKAKKGSGHGFEDIAGMRALKNLLQQKVIFVIQNKELAEQYKLTPPNGMLLYGPPGCGKTFFAEKFAEQTAFNFMLIKASDLASIYIHGTQEKIGQLFKQAEENAPTVICFDEFDAFVPNRSAVSDTHSSGEVNEFLSQLNNCAQRGIFVIATTNRPDRIDPAVLRTGRIDKHVFVPLPDKEARVEMFAIHLKGRPYEENALNLEALADMTEGYIASDIAYIVNDAAMTAAFTHSMITQEMLEQSVRDTKPSVSGEAMEMYDELQEKMAGLERQNMTIGYKQR